MTEAKREKMAWKDREREKRAEIKRGQETKLIGWRKGGKEIEGFA